MPTRTGFFTHHDLPGICTHGPVAVPGLHPYDTVPLTADQPHATFCLHFHSTPTVLTADDISAWLDQNGDTGTDPVYADTLHPVPDDTRQRPQHRRRHHRLHHRRRRLGPAPRRGPPRRPGSHHRGRQCPGTTGHHRPRPLQPPRPRHRPA